MTPEELAKQTSLKGTCPGCLRKHNVLVENGMIWGHRPATPRYGGRNIPMKQMKVEGDKLGVWVCGGSYLPPLELLRAFAVISRAGQE